MTEVALVLVLTAAVLHAGWNYLAKKSRRKIVFIWLFNVAALVLFFPMFLYFWPDARIDPRGWYYVGATGLVHSLYFWFLGMAYERGDLSLVYPIARGSGPLFVPLLAVILINEDLSILGVCGILLVVFGLYVIHLKSFSITGAMEPFRSVGRGGFVWALGTGATIAAYSVIDKVGVSLVEPALYIYMMHIITFFLLMPFVIAAGREAIVLEWRINKFRIVAVGILMIVTYLIVLNVFQFSKVSYVVVVRETSIVFSVLFGVYRLGEKHGRQKLLGAALIAIGVIGIGFTK